jgi:murein DD-endopeptidase MepM/ murein hydrolase activator NlpD
MENPKKKRNFFSTLKDRYRLVILNENTLENVWHTVLSRMNFLLWIFFICLFLIISGVVFVSFSPLREYIPGYPNENIRWIYLQNAVKMDSLEKQINMRDDYIKNIRLILKGKRTYSYINKTDSSLTVPKITLKKEKFDSVLNEQIKDEERYDVIPDTDTPKKNNVDFELNKMHIYCPLKGNVTNLFNARGYHYGVDIVSNLNEPILSVLDGTVIMAGWTLEAGYVILIQHGNNIISIYKHNSQLLKQMGDRVLAGEAIAIIGNTGELTTGPHLHFELWHNGKPLNPRDYIVF